MNKIKVMNFRFMILIIAFIISLLFILHPNPYLMGAFTFIAQPIFIGIIIIYLNRIIKIYLRKERANKSESNR